MDLVELISAIASVLFAIAGIIRAWKTEPVRRARKKTVSWARRSIPPKQK